MKFTAVAVLPGLAMANWFYWLYRHNYPEDQQTTVFVMACVVWFGTWFVLALYWAARIVRHVIGRD